MLLDLPSVKFQRIQRQRFDCAKANVKGSASKVTPSNSQQVSGSLSQGPFNSHWFLYLDSYATSKVDSWLCTEVTMQSQNRNHLPSFPQCLVDNPNQLQLGMTVNCMKICMQEGKQIWWPNILESLSKLSTIRLLFIATPALTNILHTCSTKRKFSQSNGHLCVWSVLGGFYFYLSLRWYFGSTK